MNVDFNKYYPLYYCSSLQISANRAKGQRTNSALLCALVSSASNILITNPEVKMIHQLRYVVNTRCISMYLPAEKERASAVETQMPPKNSTGGCES